MTRIVDIEVYRHHSTDRAVLVSKYGPEDNEPIWVPLAICEVSFGSNGWGTITLEEKHAKEKDLI